MICRSLYQTDSNGNYVPYSDKVIPHEKMRIFFAPIRLNYAYPMDAPYNSDCYANLKGWDAVCDKDQLIAYTPMVQRAKFSTDREY